MDLSNVSDLVIELDRFFLRTLKESDVSADYLSWFEDDRVKAYISFASKARTKQELVEYVNIKNSSKTALLFGVFTKIELKHVGNIKYEPIELAKKTAEMGILIGDVNWRGRGVGPEVILGSSEWLRNSLGLNSITLGVRSDNSPAISAYKKLGFMSDAPEFKSIKAGGIRMSLAI